MTWSFSFSFKIRIHQNCKMSRVLHPQTYLFGLRGDMSIAGPGAGMSMGNISTHISIRPLGPYTEIKYYFSFLFFTVTPKACIFPCLFDSRFVRIQQGPGLHVFRYKLAAHPRNLLPVVQHRQSQMLLGLLLQT